MIDNNVGYFVCPLPPSVNSYLGKRVAFNPITKKNFVQVYETAEAKKFKKLLSKTLVRELINEGWQTTDEYEYVICEICAYIPQKKRDTDNLFKCLLDGLTDNKIVYDDSMIIPRVKDVIIDNENPRVEVKIYKSKKIGLFKNNEHLENFQEINCYHCSRLVRNCSIRKKILENRIVKEVDVNELTCSGKKGGKKYE